MSVILAGSFYFIQNDSADRHAQERELFKQQIQILETSQIEDLKSMRIAWVPIQDIAAGHFIESNNLLEIRLPADASPNDLPMTKEDIAGKGVKIELKKGTPITSGMLFEEEITPRDLRNKEMKSIWLPSNLGLDDVVDIRIQFPTGQDYIVLSKKRINKLSSPAFWTTLSEQEILLLSSATVDAYIHKASLYALTYVEPQMQEMAIPNYPPNQEVIKLIKNDPNIVKKAERQLESSIRTALDQDLSTLNSSENMQSPSQDDFTYDQTNQNFNSWSSSHTVTDLEPLPGDIEAEDKKDRMTEANDILGGQYSADDNKLSNSLSNEDQETIFTSP